MKRFLTSAFAICFGLWIAIGCSGPVDVCPSPLKEGADNSRCCEALKFCCNQFVNKADAEKTQQERDQSVECKKFVNGTEPSCQALYASLVTLPVCKPLQEPSGSETE